MFSGIIARALYTRSCSSTRRLSMGDRADQLRGEGGRNGNAPMAYPPLGVRGSCWLGVKENPSPAGVSGSEFERAMSEAESDGDVSALGGEK